MLVLSRKVNESICIGEIGNARQMVKVTIVEILGDKVRLGFAAPQSIPIHRREIYDAIQRNWQQQDRDQQHGGKADE